MQFKKLIFALTLLGFFPVVSNASTTTKWNCTYVGQWMVMDNNESFQLEPSPEPQKVTVNFDSATNKVRISHRPPDELAKGIYDHASWQYLDGRLYSSSIFAWEEYIILNTTTVSKNSMTSSSQLVKQDQIVNATAKYECKTAE